MELIERYVKAVSSRLPEKRRADVELELRSAIMDAAEGRGARSEDEVAAVLREFGAPAVVAASYHPAGQYLIGPDLFPAYRRVLGQSLAMVVALSGLWFAVQLVLGRAEPLAAGDELLRTLGLGVNAAMWTVIGITLTFVVMQRMDVTKSLPKREWDPRTLPALLDADRVNRLESAFTLLVLGIGMAIVGAIGHEAQNGVGRAPEILRPLIRGALLAGIPWLMASMLAEAAMHAGLLVEGRRRVWWRVVHVFSDLLAVVAFGLAGVAVLRERDALELVGMPGTAVKVVGLTLLVVALFIGTGAVTREHKLSARRARERAGADAGALPRALV